MKVDDVVKRSRAWKRRSETSATEMGSIRWSISSKRLSEAYEDDEAENEKYDEDGRRIQDRELDEDAYSVDLASEASE